MNTVGEDSWTVANINSQILNHAQNKLYNY